MSRRAIGDLSGRTSAIVTGRPSRPESRGRERRDEEAADFEPLDAAEVEAIKAKGLAARPLFEFPSAEA